MRPYPWHLGHERDGSSVSEGSDWYEVVGGSFCDV